MRLVIGGYAQGKLEYVLQKYHLREDAVWDAGLCADKTGQAEGMKLADRAVQTDGIGQNTMARQADKADISGMAVINHLHRWVKQRILDGGCPEEEIWTLVEQFDDCIVISDEVGNGIVPVDPMEREYRERLGRILIQLADRAEGVERVLCGIGQTIK